ncbi:MAG: hypothetical protein EOO89_11510 [Pedobacter sp.]|nr:MAG: hypothetical protein EOO89_11510 [Pedobacter sp.]
MQKTISVNEAIRKGIYRVNLPALLIFLIGLIASFAMAYLFFKPYEMIVGLIVSYVLATAYRAFMAAKWRIWAFDKVRNVHELYDRALAEKLIHLTNRPGFGIINYNSERQKAQWEQLQAKFQQPDIFIDDQSIPAEILIRYSVFKYVVWTIVFLLMTVLGIYLCTLGHVISYIIGIPLIVTGAANGYMRIRKIFNREPQIILNNDGMSTASTPFYKWHEIANEKTIREGTGKYAMYYLSYDHTMGRTKFHLNDLEANIMRLQKLLRVYRGRNTATLLLSKQTSAPGLR